MSSESHMCDCFYENNLMSSREIEEKYFSGKIMVIFLISTSGVFFLPLSLSLLLSSPKLAQMFSSLICMSKHFSSISTYSLKSKSTQICIKYNASILLVGEREYTRVNSLICDNFHVIKINILAHYHHHRRRRLIWQRGNLFQAM